MIIDKIQEMGDNLKLLEGHDRLHYLIDKAKDIDPLPESAKTDENRIRGCASKLWVIGGAKEDGTMMYQVDGDAHISKGTAKIVTDIVNGEQKKRSSKADSGELHTIRDKRTINDAETERTGRTNQQNNKDS